MSIQGVDSAEQKCVCFQAWSINLFSYSGPLQTCEDSGSFLSCSVALAMLLTSEGLDRSHRHLALVCASTQSDGRQRLHGSQSFSFQQTGGNRREKERGCLCPSLAVDCCQPPVCPRKQFFKIFVWILQGSLPLLLSCLGHGCQLNIH